MIVIYHFIGIALLPLIVPGFALYAFFSRYKWKHLAQHFGRVPALSQDGRPILWLQALSAGEVQNAVPLLTKLSDKKPDLRIVVSVTTDSGYEMAKRKLEDIAECIFFHPLDVLPFTAMALKRIRPNAYALMDTGFWPGILRQLSARNIPALLLNGRLSQRSLKRYMSLRGLSAGVLNCFSALYMQNQSGKDGLLQLGIDAGKIHLAGDLKFDTVEAVSATEAQRLRETYKFKDEALVWIAGSTHAGEEEIIADVFRNLKESFPTLTLILAPRRLERVDEVMALFKAKQIHTLLRSEFQRRGPMSYDAVILDTYGELAKTYAIGHVAFVGNSLVPPGGGHSLIEPAAQGLPVLHGPYIENFSDTADSLSRNQLAVAVQDPQGLEDTLRVLLQNFGQLAKNAASLLQQYKGASDTLARRIIETLERPPTD